MRCRRLRMAKRGAKEAQAELPADSSATATPAPPAKLHVTLTELPQGQVLHRVHQNQYRADQFNPGVRGNARFSPIQDGRGQPLPTLYGGTTVECALMETVFHDVPHTAGVKGCPGCRGRMTRHVQSFCSATVSQQGHCSSKARLAAWWTMVVPTMPCLISLSGSAFISFQVKADSDLHTDVKEIHARRHSTSYRMLGLQADLVHIAPQRYQGTQSSDFQSAEAHSTPYKGRVESRHLSACGGFAGHAGNASGHRENRV